MVEVVLHYIMVQIVLQCVVTNKLALGQLLIHDELLGQVQISVVHSL